MGLSRPYRSSSRSIPRITKPSDRRKVVYFECGTDHNQRNGQTSLYVDVFGNSDLVDYVGFRFWPSEETHNVRKRSTVILSDGNYARRFTLKESEVENWSRKVTIAVFGKGGGSARRFWRLKARPENFREGPIKFLETQPLRSNYVIAPNCHFGVEIETSLGGGTTREDVVNAIRHYAGLNVIDRTEGYRLGSEDYSRWQLVPDSSTTCSRSDPNCNKFELVSRILSGEDGLQECEMVLAALKRVGSPSCNKSMGLHVHVNVESLSLDRRKNVCLNFLKHESAIDSFMPVSRIVSKFCKSNRDVIQYEEDGGKHKHNEIVYCRSLEELCDIVNPGQDRYFKLNLQNLHPYNQLKKQTSSTIEFRQHSCTTNFRKVEAWVRFCTSLVENSWDRPKKLQGFEDAFESLFDTVIQDLKLKEFYRERREEIANAPPHYDQALDYDHLLNKKLHACNGGGQGHACGGCLDGHACES